VGLHLFALDEMIVRKKMIFLLNKWKIFDDIFFQNEQFFKPII